MEPLSERILGRVVVDDIYDPGTDELIVEANQMVDEEAVKKISDSIIETVRIRSVLTCQSRLGVCKNCYGRNLATGKLIDLGEAVGVIAAQSIGEPGTQLTLRTFHIGGTAQVGAAQSEVKAKYPGKIVYNDYMKLTATVTDTGEKADVALGRNGKIEIVDEDNRAVAKYNVPYGALLLVKDKEIVEKNQLVCRWDPYSLVILSEFAGTVKFVDIKDGVTLKEELDEHTGLRQRVIIESRARKLNPYIYILDKKDEKLANYIIPTSARLMVKDGDKVNPGGILVKLPRGLLKSKDITGGLPRVAELFEARRPKEPAVVSEIDGIVKFGKIKRGIREIIVKG